MNPWELALAFLALSLCFAGLAVAFVYALPNRLLRGWLVGLSVVIGFGCFLTSLAEVGVGVFS